MIDRIQPVTNRFQKNTQRVEPITRSDGYPRQGQNPQEKDEGIALRIDLSAEALALIEANKNGFNKK